MSESILKLKVESSEYDTKLKKAAEGIRHLAEVAHRGGGELTGLEKSELDYIKALGDMETKSRSAAGQMRELSNTYRELKVVYDQLNEVEKADEGGKALAASLDKLRQRAIDAKDGLDQAAQSLQPMKQEGSSTSSMLEQLAGKFTINIDALKLLNFGLQGTEKALEVARDAFFASEANVDEWGRIIASSEAVYDGFLTALNNGDFSGYLDHIDEIVQAARTAYDELDRLGTMRTIQGPQYSKQEAENNRMRTMLMTGTWISAADGRKAPWGLKDGDKLTPGMMRAIERQLKNGVNSLVTLTKNEIGQTGKAIDAYYNSLAKQNGMSLSEFRKGTKDWSSFSEKMAGYDAYKEWDRNARAEFARQGGQGYVDFDKNNPYAQYRKWGTFRVDKMGQNSYNDLVGLIRQQQSQTSQMYSQMGQAYRTINRVDGTTVRSIMSGGGGGGRTGGTTTHTETPQEKAQKRMADAQHKYAVALEKAQAEFDGGNITEKDLKTAQKRAAESLFEAADDAYRTYADPQYKTVREDAKQKFVNLGGEVKTLTEIEKANQKTAREQEQAQKKLSDAQKKRADALESGDLRGYLSAGKELRKLGGASVMEDLDRQDAELPLNFTFTEANLNAFIESLKERLSNAGVGTELASGLSAQLGDATALSTMLGTANKAELDPAQLGLTSMFKQLFNMTPGDYVSDGEMKNTSKRVRKEAQKRGKSDDQKDTTFVEAFGKLNNGVTSMVGSLEQMGIQIPEGFKGVLSGISGAIGVLQAIMMIVEAIEAMQTVGTFLGIFAKGGVVHAARGFVPGNNFSDNVPALLSSGELVLNRAQQGNLASQLEGGAGLGELNLSAVIRGEQIRLVLNNNGRRTGRGEYVQSTKR